MLVYDDKLNHLVSYPNEELDDYPIVAAREAINREKTIQTYEVLPASLLKEQGFVQNVRQIEAAELEGYVASTLSEVIAIPISDETMVKGVLILLTFSMTIIFQILLYLMQSINKMLLLQQQLKQKLARHF